MNEQYDVAIVGGGAAGMTAGLYASRAGMRTVVLERLMPGGQVINAEKIENLPGFPEGISGPDFAMSIQDQATRYGAEVELSEVSELRRDEPFWRLACYGEDVRARSVIVAGGSTLRRLGVPGEERLHGAGVSYCATCDGAFFADQVVAVVGGGDSALDEAAVLTEFASRVIVFHRRDSFRGQRVLQERVLSHPKVEVRWNTVVDEILGETQVEGVATTDVKSGEPSRVDLAGVFIYVGLEPNTEYLRNVVDLDKAGHVPTDIWMRTAQPGLFAAGDIRQGSAAQLVSAAGDGATAAIAAQRYVESGYWPE
jgi:thioredoxin reductase (NADPH)